MQARMKRPTTHKALDPWPPHVSYVGNRGDVMESGSNRGETPWQWKLEGSSIRALQV